MGYFKDRNEYLFDNGVWVPRGKAHNWFTYVAAYFIRPVMKVCFRYEVRGEEHLMDPEEQPVVYACNHMSYADPVVVWCALYKHGGTRVLARNTLFRPVIGSLIARVGGIPVTPDTADRTAVKRAAACLKRGENMLIFPEGTRMNKPEKVYKPHGGVVLIAQMGKAKIIPVGLSGTEKIMPYGKAKFIRFPKLRIKFGEPIDPKDPMFDALPKKERATGVASYVMDTVFALRDSADNDEPVHVELVVPVSEDDEA